MLRALNDSSQIVSTAALTVLLPALAAWSYELGRLESDVISYFLSQLSTCIKVNLLAVHFYFPSVHLYIHLASFTS